MIRTLCKSKIQRATVTATELHYDGSLTLDPDLMREADLLPYEKIQVVNLYNGERLETYVIEGKPGAGEVILNGPAARKGYVGDLVTIISYAHYDDEEAAEVRPRVINVDTQNRPVRG